ncbi:FAD-binding-3 domain-containing protein [Mycena chlorophos]|uniref:FAD-binding-3 domain-containing protein n=1 Tax=Mycena chlorophos TaxID=658473 RepID=A0A8H6WJ80_MYCCL|nr:FAD-binding-3 domain-containing protein [Mycena chlorophos]
MTASKPALHFIVVGASVAGLATAIALQNAGHSVTVLEKAPQLGSPDDGSVIQGCARVAPNAYKILAEWGLETELRRHGVVNAGFGVYKYDGKKPEGRDLMGINTWDPELLVEARGDFIFIAHKLLLKMLYNRAISPPSGSARVKVIFGAEVASVDCDSEEPAVTLSSGDVYRGDAVIGADGATGAVRRALMAAEGAQLSEDEYTGMMVYSAVVPYQAVSQHRDLDVFFDFPQSSVSMGSGRGFVTDNDGAQDIFIFVYTPEAPYDGSWTETAPTKISEVLGSCDPSLKKLASLAGPTSAFQIKKFYELDSWVSESGKVLALGEAAHPAQACGLHTYSLAFEDGVFIGKIFSHSNDRERVPELFYAFEEHRKPRCAFLKNIEEVYIGLITLADGEAQVGRDSMMRANHAAGLNVLAASGELGMQEMLDETRRVFSYDANDDADEWWMSWGRYRRNSSIKVEF